MVLAIPVLIVIGARVVLDSSDGRLVNRVTDPAAPGWEAVLDPTPTELVLTVDAAGELESVAVLVLSGEGSGAVLQVPAETLVDMGPDVGEVSLAFGWFANGADGARDMTGRLLDLSFTDTRVLTPEDWASVVAPVAPLTVNSPDAATGPDGVEVFPRGSIQLEATEVPAYMSATGPSETDVARLVRVEALWRSWLNAVGVAGMESVPQPLDQGLGLFVGTLGAEQVRFVTLPVADVGEEGVEVYRAEPEDVARVVGELVPFPEGPPGTRPSARVLDGTGQLDRGVSAAIVIGAAGGQVRVIGNAEDFDIETTEIVYYDDSQQAAAEAVRDALGVGEVIRSEQKSPVDVTVVLGADALSVPALAPAPSTVPGVPLPEEDPGA
nr:LytR C-terminal domain-containing protein [Rhabdothermincola salaria]